MKSELQLQYNGALTRKAVACRITILQHCILSGKGSVGENSKSEDSTVGWIHQHYIKNNKPTHGNTLGIKALFRMSWCED